MDNDKTKKQKHVKAYETFPLAYEHEKDKDTNMTIPSPDDIEEVMHWSEENKK